MPFVAAKVTENNVLSGNHMADLRDNTTLSFEYSKSDTSCSEDLIALMPASELKSLIEASGYDMRCVPHLLERAGTSPTLFSDVGGLIQPELVWRVLQVVGYELQDEGLGFFSQSVPSGSTELMVARALHEPTLGQAMAAFVDAGRILWPDLNWKFKSRLGELHFSISCKNIKAPRDEAQIFLEIACIPFYCIFQWLAGAEIHAKRVHVADTRPESAIHLLAALDCPVLFDGEGVEIIFPDSISDLPTSTRALKKWREGMVDFLVSAQQKHTQSFASQELQTVVKRALRRGIRSQAAIADSVAMSVATLRRRLMMEKTSFRELNDQAFRESVSSLIARGDSIEVITAKMGYADARSFRRAFQRVFNVSPSELRKSIQENQAKLSPFN